MRLITVKAPEGEGRNIAETAFAAGVTQVSVRLAKQITPGQQEKPLDVVEMETATPIAKQFIEELMTAPFYHPATFSISLRHPEAIFASEPPEKETYPIVRPTAAVYEELWQFTRLTVSLVTRVFLSAVLLAYGMVEDMLPLIIAGLLFLPYHHHMLGISLGGVIKEWRFFCQGLVALLVSTVLIVLAGICVAFFTKPPIGFQEFGSPVAGAILAAIIGVAAAFAAMDDAGRRELIGLAATAHISVYPAWFGLKLIFGMDEGDKWQEHLLSFGINVVALMVAAAITFKILGMSGEGIRRFVKQKTGTA